MTKTSKLATLATLLSLSVPVLANDVREEYGKLHVTIDAFSDSYALFEKLGVKAETADQGLSKRFEQRGSNDMLTIICNFDHRTVCEFTYENAAHSYLTDEQGRSGILIPSSEVAMALYKAIAMAPITGYGQSRKSVMTSDSKLEIQCTRYDAKPGQPSCMFEIIK